MTLVTKINEGIPAEIEQINAEVGVESNLYSERFDRPWGFYETLMHGTRFQVKRIVVKPGGVLSLQSHMHRAETWVVVAGCAKVTVGDEVKLLGENDHVRVPLGEVHRMENPGKTTMHLIEVQCGAYLGEDDIIRYEDAYGRS